jgi:chromatin assembly factor 1 subunit A
MLEGDQAGSDAIILPKPSQDSDSLYRHDFRPFFVKPSVSLAPWNRFITTKDIESICKAIDACLESPKGLELEEGVNKALHLRNLCSSRPRSAQRLRQRTLPGVKDIVLRIQGTVNNPVDLTHESDSASLLADPLKALMSVPIKVLQYHEDVRPPYRGTFTRLPPRGSALRLGKNPFERSLPDIDYDYDSEAEWEDIAPGDGEDLDSESDDDGGAADDDGEDMEGFLDDTEEDDAVRAKRLLIKDEMEPYCSGLWWENVQAEPQHDGDPGPGPTFQPMQYRMELLDCQFNPALPSISPISHEQILTAALFTVTAQLPIDPCPAGFWSVSAPKSAGSNGPVHSMGPPRYGKEDQAHARPPLSQIPFAHSNGGAADAAPSSSRGPRRSQRALTPEELEIFKSTVQGSSHTKGTLVEVLKKQYVSFGPALTQGD